MATREQLTNLVKFWFSFTSDPSLFSDPSEALSDAAEKARETLNIPRDPEAVGLTINNLGGQLDSNTPFYISVSKAFAGFPTVAGALVQDSGGQIDQGAIRRLWLLLTTRPDLFQSAQPHENAAAALDDAVKPLAASQNIDATIRRRASSTLYGFGLHRDFSQVRTDFSSSSSSAWPRGAPHPDTADLSSI